MKQYAFANTSAKDNFRLFLEDATGSASNLYTAFHASYTDVDDGSLTARVTQEANGTVYGTNGVEIAGTSKAVVKVKPVYLPFMKRGCKYAGVISGLSDADSELTVYQYIKLPSGKFFVWGIANATETDFYSPKLTGTAIKHIVFQ